MLLRYALLTATADQTLGCIASCSRSRGPPPVRRCAPRARHAPSRDLTIRALAIQEAVYGPEHPDVARTLGNLGNVQQQLGEFEAARVSQQRALAIEEAVYGPEHPEVAITLGNLGIVQRQLREFEAARACVARASAIFERFLGRDHATTRQARELLASLEGNPPTGSDAG